MKKRIFSFLLIVLMIQMLLVSVSAQTFYGKEGWKVVFTPEEEMQSNFSTADWNDPISGLQPGDDVYLTVDLTNEHQETTDWYMENEIIKSLEDQSSNENTHGGAYTYELYYDSTSGVHRDLFSSDTVGGESVLETEQKRREGLNEATNNLEEYFYLDTLPNGQGGTVTLHVALDGETQGNDYQDTLAQLRLRFAVELGATSPTPTPSNTPTPTPSSSVTPTPSTSVTPTPTSRVTPTPTPTTTRVVKTGDETDLIPYLVVMAVSGLLFLALAIYSLHKRRQARKGGM